MNKSLEHDLDGNKRLISYVKKLHPHLSRKHIFDLIKNGSVLVNGSRKRPNYKLGPNDNVDFVSLPLKKDMTVIPNADMAPKILYRDDHILAVEKTRGIPTHPNRFEETNTLANGLAALFPQLRTVGKKLECGLLNRLDNHTSGILLAAKTQPAYESFKESFAQKRICKEYMALVHGHPTKQGRIVNPLKHDPKNKRKMKTASVKARGKGIYRAVTEYRVIQRTKDHSLVLLSLNSAVTHQLRVHMASIGHGIAGDTLYRAKSSKPAGLNGLKGHFLHASMVRFWHPFLKKEITVRSELPEELQKIIDMLEGV